MTYFYREPARRELEWADTIALTAHENQVDKSGQPYILHPRRVASRLEGHDERVVALLHDVLEDAPIESAGYFLTLMELSFSHEVVNAVVAITHTPNEPNVGYWARVKANPLALAVKLADIADNTDPRRLEKLDDATRERLTAKYARAVEFLTADG